MEKEKNKKVIIRSLILGAALLLCFYLSPYLIYAKSEVVCAKVKQEGHGRGRNTLIYFYKYNGQIYKGNFEVSSGNCPKVNCYEDECLDIEVSTMFPSFSRLKKK